MKKIFKEDIIIVGCKVLSKEITLWYVSFYMYLLCISQMIPLRIYELQF